MDLWMDERHGEVQYEATRINRSDRYLVKTCENATLVVLVGHSDIRSRFHPGEGFGSLYGCMNSL
jgi:hypothetical protein